MRNAHGTIYVGIDVSKDKLAVAIAGGERGDDVLSLGTFENTPARQAAEEACRAGQYLDLLRSGANGLRPLQAVRAFGYDGCVVVPSLIPVRPGERVKTDRLDAIRLARLLRAGELTPVSISRLWNR